MSKIIQYRSKCIGCNSCVEHAPNTWEISEDGKSTLKNAEKKGGIYRKEIDKAAADCPMHIIQILP